MANDYIRFSAESMKDLLTQSLNSNNVFTDQNFQDSNLSVFIDITSVMFTYLMFYGNASATEGMFTDSQIYENMNRLVKMLGYNPDGFVSSIVQTNLNVINNQSLTLPGGNARTLMTIPKYSTCATSLFDSNGNQIKFTFVEDYPFATASTTSIDKDFTPTVVNGEWKLYPTTFTAAGIPFETFTLNQILLFGDGRKYVSNNNIDVIAQLPNGSFAKYTPAVSMYSSAATDRNFEPRINENYNYTLKFGDGITGARLPAGSTIYVIYLETNGPDGQVGANALDGTQPLRVSIVGLSELFIKQNILKVQENKEYVIFGDGSIGYDATLEDPQLQKLTLQNALASSFIKDLETVDQIRENAPNAFRMGSRLIIEQDFYQFVKKNYATNVYDVAVMNNWAYMSEFQKWLLSYGRLTSDVRHFGYEFADACDFNNIYLWLKSFDRQDSTNFLSSNTVSSAVKRQIERDCDKLKCATAEIIIQDPLLLTVSPHLNGTYDLINFDPNYENKIILVRDKNTLITIERIRQRALNVIKTFFSLEHCGLGMVIRIDDLYNQLMAIDGVRQVSTKYLITGGVESQARYYNGLSFGIWTNSLIQGLDFTSISGNYKIQNFQFPYLYDANNFSNRLEVVSDNYKVPEVEF